MTEHTSQTAVAHWFGDRAVMVSVASNADRSAVVGTLERQFPDLVVRAGMETVLVEAPQPTTGLLEKVREVVASVGRRADPVSGVDTCVVIPVAYGGEDLPMVAQALRASVEDVIRAHQEQRWTVAMMGFAPGFGYLVPIGDPLLDWTALARRDRPRERVASGSVAVAVGMSAVYPADMPGGWHLIGRTSLRLFDPADDATPSVLRPGVEVRFRGDTA